VTLAVLSTVLVVAILLVTVGGNGKRSPSSTARNGSTTTTAAHGTTGTVGRPPPPTSGEAPAVEAGLLPWQLAAPLSREVVLPGPSGQLVVIGGLTSASTSSGAITALAVPGGVPSAIGSLASPTHDAAGVALRGRYLLFGGGAQTTVASVEALPTGAAAGASTGVVVGQLPQPRSDASAIVVGRTAYVIGGYDGTRGDPAVLATTDGKTYSTVATLPVAVRYPAVAALGTTIYVFGGQAVGAHAGPVTDVQAIDLVSRQARVVAHLPEPLEGASAARVGGHLYLFGGDSSSGAAANVPAPDGTNAPAAGPGSDAGTFSVPTVWSFDPATRRLLVAGTLQVPVSHASSAVVGATVWLVGGERGGTPVAAVQMLRPDARFGRAGAPGAGSPYFGAKLLIADRGNDRLLLLSDAGSILWSYPNATAPAPPGPKGFYFPDDAFFIHHGQAILVNQEENETLVEIAYPSGKILWTYGHPGQIGSGPGYLHEPDDAYLFKNGQITVADADNCRILILNPDASIAGQIGTTGVCTHHPPTSLGAPNGDTPLPDGNLLISEVTGSWVSEYTPSGQLVWTTHVAVSYPSDPQPLGPDLYLLADYATPGGIIEFDRAGNILYRYQPASGPGMLNQPSLVEQLPSGAFLANDDFGDRMVSIDPTTGALVWQYGVTDHPGTAPGLLNIPDGFDILLPDGSTPTHPQTG